MRISDWSSDVCSSDLLSVQCNESGAHEKYRAISLRRSQALIAPTGCGRDVAVEFQLRQRHLQVRDALPAERPQFIELEQLVPDSCQLRRGARAGTTEVGPVGNKWFHTGKPTWA